MKIYRIAQNDKAHEISEPNYVVASDSINGFNISDDVPNVSSIEATLSDYKVLDEIRIVPMSDFEINGKSYSLYENERIKNLEVEMRQSKTISPLIVVVEADGPYVLEGSHRVDALFNMGWKDFPALVVISYEDI